MWSWRVSRGRAIDAPRLVRPRDFANFIVLAVGQRKSADPRRATLWLQAKRLSKAQFHNVLAELVPRRFAESWCNAHMLNKPMNEMSDIAFNHAIDALADWQIKPSGTLGYNKAEVTLGGVDTRDLSSKTMAATTQPNLFFIGEVVDVTGHLGGFNFQWAWASGHAAGIAIAERRT